MNNRHPASRWLLRSLLLLALAHGLSPALSALDFKKLTDAVDADRSARYEVFRHFQIKGVCGTARLDLASAYGANTIRTYTPPTREQLDEYQRLGFKVVVGIWMPHHGMNAGKDGRKWNYDYETKGAEQLKSFAEVVDRIGDHPAILLWCLGNEVHLEPPYLATVNRMSQLLHQKYPGQLTSLTMINAPKEKIALINQYAPDLDVIGYNSYGQGAVSGASRNLEETWGRAYYVSEFGPQGPWSGRKTAWGACYEQSYDVKLKDLRQSFQKIDAAPLCLGSTMFLWGYWQQQLPTYFSAFLTPDLGTGKKAKDPELYLTPMSDEFCHYWSGKYPENRAPVLTGIKIAGLTEKADAIFAPEAPLHVTAVATDPDTPASALRYRWWILGKSGQVVSGPVDSENPQAELLAPKMPGHDYAIMGLVIAPDKSASGFTVPLKIE